MKMSTNLLSNQWKNQAQILWDHREYWLVSPVLDKYQDCQNYFSRFQDLFKNIYNKSFPIKKVKKQYRTRIPWLSVELKKLNWRTKFY